MENRTISDSVIVTHELSDYIPLNPKREFTKRQSAMTTAARFLKVCRAETVPRAIDLRLLNHQFKYMALHYACNLIQIAIFQKTTFRLLGIAMKPASKIILAFFVVCFCQTAWPAGECKVGACRNDMIGSKSWN